MSQFFDKFPFVKYNFPGDVNKIIKNFTRHVSPDDKRIQKLIQYELYNIPDGDRPENVSYDLYGNDSFHWTFFLLNDNLRQNGLNSWPLSDHLFRKYINETYGIYAIIYFFPWLDGNTLNNYFSGIDFNQKDLRLLSVDTGITAKIFTYEIQTFQGWFYDFENGSGKQFINSDTYQLRYQKTSENVLQRQEWIHFMIFDYFQKIRPDEFEQFISNDIKNNNLIPFTDAYYDYFYNNYIINLTFLKNQSNQLSAYFPSYNAPKSFINEFDNSVINIFDFISIPHINLNGENLLLDNQNILWTPLPINESTQNISLKTISYIDYEYNIKDINSKLKVIRPQFITTFLNTFEDLISI